MEDSKKLSKNLQYNNSSIGLNVRNLMLNKESDFPNKNAFNDSSPSNNINKNTGNTKIIKAPINYNLGSKLINEVQSINLANKNDLTKFNFKYFNNQNLRFNPNINQNNFSNLENFGTSPTHNNINNKHEYSNYYKSHLKMNNNNASNSNLNINTSDNENISYQQSHCEGKKIFNSENLSFLDLKKKFESQTNVIDEYENWLIMLLNIVAQSKYKDYNGNIELVNFFI